MTAPPTNTAVKPDQRSAAALYDEDHHLWAMQQTATLREMARHYRGLG